MGMTTSTLFATDLFGADRVADPASRERWNVLVTIYTETYEIMFSVWSGEDGDEDDMEVVVVSGDGDRPNGLGCKTC